MVGGERVGAGDVQPPRAPLMLTEVSSTCSTCASTSIDLISFSTSASAAAASPDVLIDPAGRRAGPGQVGDQLRGSGHRHVLEHQQIHRQRPQTRPVLHRALTPAGASAMVT